MNFFRWILKAFTRLPDNMKSVGERVISTYLPRGWFVGQGGTWGSSSREQVNHYRGWTYIAVKAIAETIAGFDPQVAYIVKPEDVPEPSRKKRLLPKRRRTKAVSSAQHHEELELCDSDHPLVRLLRNPNGPDVAWTWLFRLSLYLNLTGDAYIWLIPNQLGLPVEMWILPSHWVTPIHDKNDGRMVDHYEIRPYSSIGGYGMFRIPENEIVAVSYPSPTDLVKGYSPLTAVAEWIDIAESIDSSRWSSFKMGAWPGMIVELTSEYMNPDQEQIDRLSAKMQSKYAGERNVGKPMFVPPGMRITPATRSPGEMEFVSSSEQMRDFILAAFGVSKAIVGITEEVNRASMETATANFITRTIKPKLLFISQILTEKLAKRFHDDLCIFWEDIVPEDRAQQLAENQAYLANGVKTINEVRAELGLEPYQHGGDDPFMAPGLAPVPLATGQEADDGDMQAILQALQGGQQQQPQQPEPGVKAKWQQLENGQWQKWSGDRWIDVHVPVKGPSNGNGHHRLLPLVPTTVGAKNPSKVQTNQAIRSASKQYGSTTLNVHCKPSPVMVEVKSGIAEDDEDSDSSRIDAIADILGGLFGDDALGMLDAETDSKEFDESKHPRAEDGKFGSGAGSSKPKDDEKKPDKKKPDKPSKEELRKRANELIAAAKKNPTKKNVQALADHLATMTVKELHELKKQHGLKASGRLKADLVAKLGQRFSGTETPKTKPTTTGTKKPPTKNPVVDVPKVQTVSIETPTRTEEKPKIEETKNRIPPQKPPLVIGTALGDRSIPDARTLKDIDAVEDAWNRLSSPADIAARLQIVNHLGLSGLDANSSGWDVSRALTKKLEAMYNPEPGHVRAKNDPVIQATTAAMAERHKQNEARRQEYDALKREESILYEKWREASDMIYTRPEGMSTREINKRVKEAKKLHEEAKGKLDELRTKYESATADDRAAIKSHLKVDNASPIVVRGHEGRTPEVKQALGNATTFLDGIVASGTNGETIPPYSVIHDDSDLFGRGHPSAYYRNTDHAINVSSSESSKYDADTHVHEMAHGIEYKMPGAQKAAHEFLAHRVGNQPLKKLRETVPDGGYADWEEGRDDDFGKALGDHGAWYAGKKPTVNGGTEIISMGVQKLYNDPAGFAARDPEYFGFIVGILNGKARHNQIPQG